MRTIKSCERCHAEPRVKNGRFCKWCQADVLHEMHADGYLQPVLLRFRPTEEFDEEDAIDAEIEAQGIVDNIMRAYEDDDN